MPVEVEKRLYHVVADDLRARVLSSGSGSVRLPTESELCREHGVSRATVRRAYDILVAERLVSRRPSRGSFVRTHLPRNFPSLSGVLVAVNITYPPGAVGFLGQEMMGITEFLEMHDMHLVVKRDLSSPGEALSFVQHLAANRVGGLLYHSFSDERTRAAAQAAAELGLPTVLLDTHMEDLPLDSVVCDNVAGGALVADYFLKLGHRRLAYVCDQNVVTLRDRWEGFRRAVQERGGEAACYGPWQENAEPPLDRFLAGADRFSGVFCGNDALAGIVMRSLDQRGLRVPENVSVVGFDDNRDVCEHSITPLTSVAQSAHRMGARAAQFLWERLSAAAPSAPRRVQLEPKLVTRSSVASLLAQRM